MAYVLHILWMCATCRSYSSPDAHQGTFLIWKVNQGWSVNYAPFDPTFSFLSSPRHHGTRKLHQYNALSGRSGGQASLSSEGFISGSQPHIRHESCESLHSRIGEQRIIIESHPTDIILTRLTHILHMSCY